MKRLKGFFFITSLLVSVLLMWNFIQTQTEFSKKKVKSNDFKIIEVTGDGVFYKSQIIDKDNIQKIDLSNQDIIDKLSIYVDNNTTFKFRFFDSFFIVLPDSFLKYNLSIISLLKGEFYWNEEKSKKNKKISSYAISLPDNKKLFLSRKGRIVISDSEIKVWNYDGSLTLRSSTEEFQINKGEYLSLKDGIVPIPVKFPPKPIILRPENNLIILRAKNTIVQFQWKELLDFKQNKETIYILKLYSSVNMGKLYEDQEKNANGLFSAERRTNATNIPVDFSALSQTNTIFWRIFPYDKTTNLEGEPSEIRKLQIANFLLNNKKAQLPPKLLVDPPSISGNIVILSGEADPKSRLFVDGKEYDIDEDGKFNLNLSFEKSGIYTIVFELISPSDRKNIQKKIVRIY